MKEPSIAEHRVHSALAEYDLLRHVGPEGPCPYLPELLSRNEAFGFQELSSAQYDLLMTRGFRRSGRVVYRPRCRGCTECRPLRIPVKRFTHSRSLHRVWAKNQDVRLEVSRPQPSAMKFDLFSRYLEVRHDGTMPRSVDSFEQFLYDSPTDTLEFSYFLGDRLIGVSIADRCPSGLSSVYMFCDPDVPRRSLGTFSILREIDWCAAHALPYYYLGFFIAQSPTMAYKARFRPNEMLTNGKWVAFLD